MAGDGERTAAPAADVEEPVEDGDELAGVAAIAAAAAVGLACSQNVEQRRAGGASGDGDWGEIGENRVTGRVQMR